LQKPVTGAAAIARARHFHADPTVGRRHEQAGTRLAPRVLLHPDGKTGRVQPRHRPASRFTTLRDVLEHNLLQISAALFLLGALGWCWLIVNEFRGNWSTPAVAVAGGTRIDSGIEKTDAVGSSSYERMDRPLAVAAPYPSLAGAESPASIVEREWSRLETRVAERGRALVKRIAKAPVLRPPVRVAAIGSTVPQLAPATAPSHVMPNFKGETTLVDFETAPFPYHGTIPGTNRPFLNVGESGRLGHANFRGHVLWESQTFSDDRVLLHIPPGFDPRRPAVMVVFFHGHGADLARDVRDRQKVPDQITAAGANAVLVAPQFAFDAADSSAGKFWEPNGFKRFLDEAAGKLAHLYGDPRSAFVFARMPIVIVAYSGGFGPTLSVLDRGGVRSRVRGIVLLDALYAGIDKFAEWIADNRSSFFISSYTPHTAHHNADLENLLSGRSIPYGSELRHSNLQGTVTFLPTGDISHRDFVNRAWAGNPIADVLARMDDIETNAQTARAAAARSTGSVAAARN
jgi:hypothetical protein